MRSPLERVDEAVIRRAVTDHWRLSADGFRYFPEGGGAYHWIAEGDGGDGDGGGDGGRRWFVTCDDLDTKPWLGADRDTVFDNLSRAYATAIALRRGGLSFVAGPTATVSGEPAVRIDERHSVSVLPFVDGDAGRWGSALGAATTGDVVALLAELHAVVPPTGLFGRDLTLPGRDALEDALAHLDSPWDGGPLSEPARHELAGSVAQVHGWLGDLDRAVGRAGEAGDGDGAVVTHGEPHPGNLIQGASGLVLVDWDTVALAPPERDLWMLAAHDLRIIDAYRALTGRALDRDALVAYRLLWALADLTAFTTQLRGEHERTVDDERALVALRMILGGREPAPYGPPIAAPGGG